MRKNRFLAIQKIAEQKKHEMTNSHLDDDYMTKPTIGVRSVSMTSYLDTVNKRTVYIFCTERNIQYFN